MPKIFEIFVTLFFLLNANCLLGQEKRYFTRNFQNMTTEKTEFMRDYTFNSDEVIISDFKNEMLQHKALFRGVKNLEDVNAFAWYCISMGSEINYKEYFEKASAVFENYSEGKITSQVLVRGHKVRYTQYWGGAGQILINGSGEYVCPVTKRNEELHLNFKDSILTEGYLIRGEQKDTIYSTYDKMASPKEGLNSFYQNLVETLRYPGIARLLGKEGRVYVEFVVDQNGKLSDFAPVTQEGFRFEAKVLKKLRSLPNWNPAIYNNRPVKTRFTLPVKFQFSN